jgi:hypothetical protein
MNKGEFSSFILVLCTMLHGRIQPTSSW